MARVQTPSGHLSNAGQLRVLSLPATGKSASPLPTESSVEADGLLELTHDPDVVRIVVQPETFRVWVNGIAREYTPDAMFVRRSGAIGYREFKSAARSLEPDYVAKLEAVAADLRAQGYEFSVVTDEQLRVGHRIGNLRLLRRYRQWPTSDAFKRRILDHLMHRLRCELGELCDLVGYDSYGPLYRMLWEQQVGFDLARHALSRSTTVWSIET